VAKHNPTEIGPNTTVAFYGFTSIWEAEDICLGWCELVVGSEYDGVLGWRAELAELQKRLGELFGRTDARRQANLYLEGLLSAVERKNGWQLAEQIGDARPWRTQRVLSRTLWAADAARDLCREYVVEHLGAADGVLVIDETGFLKKGSKSAGVARQYSGTAGRIENCQIGVFLAYASGRGHALIDRELYLPQGWAEDGARRATAGIPRAVSFATKPQLAQRMIARAIAAGVPFAWVVGDEVYGSDRRLRLFLEKHERPFVLAIRRNEKLWSMLAGRLGQHTAVDLAAAVPDAAWHRLSAGAGAKGERLYDWARVRLARLQAPPWEHWLLIRRSHSKPEECASYVVFAPAETTLAALARVAGRRWTIEECFEAGKQEVGLGDYEIRSWQGWYRHITLALLALAFLAALRAKLNRATAVPDKRGSPDLAFRLLSARLRSAVSSPSSRP
jgi:SRSO17 transposase